MHWWVPPDHSSVNLSPKVLIVSIVGIIVSGWQTDVPFGFPLLSLASPPDLPSSTQSASTGARGGGVLISSWSLSALSRLLSWFLPKLEMLHAGSSPVRISSSGVVAT